VKSAPRLTRPFRPLDWLIAMRYPILICWAAGWFELRYITKPKGLDDWLWFEFGARTLIHLNSHFASGGLQLYAHYPVVQIGPPPLAVVAALQWLSPAAVAQVTGVLMALAGVICVRSAETVARTLVAPEHARRIKLAVLNAGLVAISVWAWDVARWQHLDDVMAVTFCLAAMALIARGRLWWLAAILVGLAIASKPWALVMAPVLMALPREHRARAALVTMASTAIPWLPFIVSDHSTISALSGFRFAVAKQSAVHTLGMPLGYAPHWARPLQLLGGFAIASVVVRRGRWEALPIAALGLRVVTDPQSWAYYGLGPLMGAMLLDVTAARRVPVWTTMTAVVEFGVRAYLPGWTGPVQLVWFAAVLIAVLRNGRAVNDERSPTEGVADPALEAVTV
jgi:hypothetical protein